MAGPNLSDLSSNWKILQGRLNSGKKLNQDDAPSNGVKRKRPLQPSKSSNPFKEPRTTPTDSNAIALTKKRSNMGGYVSSLTRDHDIAPQDISAAYNARTTSTTSQAEEINTGLHPTHKPGKYLSLDCEMVGTGPPPYADHLLARASLVNYHGHQIYDSYVLPPSIGDVKDYRTHVSGITERHLRPGTARPFAQVQADVAALLTGKILVGHAVRNDLAVLLLSHPKRDVRDTSRYAKFRVEGPTGRTRTPALRNLARSELGMEIQTGEHSSVEDARAAMLLFRKEKVGFEEENRRLFGVRKAGKAVGRVIEKEEEDDDRFDEEDEEEDLDGEDEELADLDTVGSGKAAGQPKTKKRKKKKRTKRKQ